MNVDTFSNGLYWILLQFVQNRNSSSFVQQSAQFIAEHFAYYKINLWESLIVNRFVNFYTSESVSLSFSTFHVTFIKIVNIDKNNKRVY